MHTVWFLFIAILCIGTAAAQEVVFNGDFEAGVLTPFWTLAGGNANTEVVVFDTQEWEFSPTLKRRPGPPDDNGGIEQQVHLMGGTLYLFEADIASEFCSS